MKIAIYIPDAAWGHSSDEEYERDSARYRRKLENEFRVSFKRRNIGPGADFFAFETWLTISPWWSLAAGPIALFFLGKKINDGLEAWPKIVEKINRFASHRPHLNRDAAGVLAVNAVAKNLGRFPKSVQLIGYGATAPMHKNLTDDVNEFDFSSLTNIDDAPEPLFLLQTAHAFRCEMDSEQYGILVYRDQTAIRKLQ